MKISLLIPTRNRPEYLRDAVTSALNSSHAMEVIVSDCSENNDSSDVLSDYIRQKKILYIKSSPKNMRDNWEKALEMSTGEYIGVMGDDDAITIDAAHWVAKLVNQHEVDAVMCAAANYKHMDYPFPARRGMLSFSLHPNRYEIYEDLPKMLRAWLQFEVDLGTGPGIYQGFISRKLIEKVTKQRGRYFIDLYPDLDSGVSTLMYGNSFTHTTYPLFISGHSFKSNSSGMHLPSRGLEKSKKFAQENGLEIVDLLRNDAISVHSNTALIVNGFERLLPEIRDSVATDFKVNYQAAISKIIAEKKIGYDNTQFKADLENLNALALRYAVGISSKSSKSLAPGASLEKGYVSNKKESRKDKLIFDTKNFNNPDIIVATKLIKAFCQFPRIQGEQKIGDILPAKDKIDASEIDRIITTVKTNDNIYEAIEILNEFAQRDGTDPYLYSKLGELYYEIANWESAEIFLSRSLSMNYHETVLNKLIDCKIHLNKYSEAKNLISLEFKNSGAKEKTSLKVYCDARIQIMNSNYLAALELLEDISASYLNKNSGFVWRGFVAKKLCSSDDKYAALFDELRSFYGNNALFSRMILGNHGKSSKT